MVNTGRPSLACKACRSRRLKCDQTKPGCTKCRKAKRPCPGYREGFEVNFKDQTEAVIRRHKRTSSTSGCHKSRKPYEEDQGRSGACDLLDVAGATSDLELVQYNILDRNVTHRKPSGIVYSISLEQSLPHLATCYFMSVFVNLPSHTPTGTLQFITPLVRATSEDSALHAALLAVSMAALASRPNPGALVPLSREYYNKALVKMSETLSNEKRMGTDESLAAIIMLIFYEALMWENAKDNLKFHIRGAQAIIRSKGARHKSSPLGKAMSEFIRVFMINQYAIGRCPNVDEMMWWVEEDDHREGPNDILQGLNVETAILRKQLADFLSSDPEIMMAPVATRMYRKAKKLETDVRTWFNTMRDDKMRSVDYWQEDATPEEKIHHARAYPGRVYTFRSIFIAAKYLNIHLQWLMLAEIMAKITNWIQIYRPSDDIIVTQRCEAVALAKEQISEVIAIAPYYCMWPTYEEPSSFGGLACSFPLFVAASSPFTNSKQRAYLLGRLRHLSTAAGLKSTNTLANKLACPLFLQ